MVYCLSSDTSAFSVDALLRSTCPHSMMYSEYIIWCRFEFYFAYCEAAFDCRYLQDYQILWQRIETPHPQPSLQQRLHATSSQKYLPCETEQTDLPEKEERSPGVSADHITSALFAVYCVLAGIVVARQPRMLLALISFAAGQVAHKARSFTFRQFLKTCASRYSRVL